MRYLQRLFQHGHQNNTDLAAVVSLETPEQAIQGIRRLYARHIDMAVAESGFDEARNYLSLAFERFPEVNELKEYAARLYLRQGDWQKATHYSDQLLAEQKNHPFACFVYGFQAYKRGEHAQAKHWFHRAIQGGGWNSGQLWLGLSTVYGSLAEDKKGLEWLAHKLVSLACIIPGWSLWFCEEEWPTIPQTLGFMLGALRVKLTASSKALQPGAEQLIPWMRLQAHYPGSPWVGYTLANMYRERGAVDEAIQELHTVLERCPLYEGAYYELGSMYESTGRLEEALGVYRKLLQFRPYDPDLHCRIGNMLYAMEQHPAAMSSFKAALQFSKTNEWRALMARSIGDLYHNVFRDVEAAQMAFQSALQWEPENLENYVHLGLLYFERGEHDNAQYTYEMALSRSAPDSSYRPKLLTNIGYLMWMKGNVPQAMSYYERAISANTDYDIPHNNLGVLYMDMMGQVEQAIGLLEKATQLNPHYALAYYNLGRAYSMKNDKLEAAHCFQMARQLNEYTCELDNNELEERISELFNANQA
jgi:tetratricopeptide (TPR) repeat protein